MHCSQVLVLVRELDGRVPALRRHVRPLAAAAEHALHLDDVDAAFALQPQAVVRAVALEHRRARRYNGHGAIDDGERRQRARYDALRARTELVPAALRLLLGALLLVALANRLLLHSRRAAVAAVGHGGVDGVSHVAVLLV